MDTLQEDNELEAFVDACDNEISSSTGWINQALVDAFLMLFGTRRKIMKSLCFRTKCCRRIM